MITEAQPEPRTQASSRHAHIVHIGLILLILAAIGAYLLNEHWPYRYRNVKPALESLFASQISIKHYRRLYFPSPGFSADELTLKRNSAPNLPPIGSIEHLRVTGRWSDLLLFRRRIDLVEAEGLHVVIPPVGSQANHEDFPQGGSADFTGPKIAVGKLDIHNALLDIMRTDGTRYSFPIWRLLLQNLKRGQSASYYVKMRNAVPIGDIEAHGSIGPIIAGKLGQSPLSGEYTFTSVKLEDVPGLHGLLSASGSFHGQLGGVTANTRGTVRDFAVKQGRPVQITGSATGAVDALNGDVDLHTVDLHTGNTDVHATGRIAGAPKITNLEITVPRGRAEDILQPFLHGPPPVTGPVRLRSHAHLAPAEEGRKFMQRLTMEGSFVIPQERVTNPNTAKSLTAFSERAQGGHEPTSDVAPQQPQASSSLEANAEIRDGIVQVQQLTFTLPGALVHLTGDFNLQNQAARLHGDMRMQADLSHTTTGFKSAVLKVFAPFFKRKHAGAQMPIAVTGRPGQYKVTQAVIGHHG